MEDNESPEPAPTMETAKLAAILSQHRSYLHTLPPLERRIALLAADSTPVWEIARQTETSEVAVWRTIDGILAVVSGREVEPVESGGLGADTDPGVTGGYGEDPAPLLTEPEEKDDDDD